jgi:fatty-acyl-CoA synthase
VNELRTLPEALAQAADSSSGYVFVDGPVERRRSYAAIYQAASARADAFRREGLGRGDLVALIVGDEEQFLTALFGASIAGLVPASLYPPTATIDLPRFLEASARMLRSARARAVVIDTPWLGAMADLQACCPDLAVVLSSDSSSPGSGSLDRPVGLEGMDGGARGTSPFIERDRRVGLDDIAFVQFTSGSTARPKGVAITHRSLVANISAINGPAGLDASDADSAVSWLPLYHDMGLVGMALGALFRGRPAVLMTPATFVKRPVEWLRAISRHRATVSFAPNFAYDLCVRRVKAGDLDGLDLSCWRVAGCGAEPIHAATLTAFADKFRPAGFRDTSFLPSYGLAEHVLAATFAPVGRAPRIDRRSGVEVVSCGPPLPDHRIRIVGGDADLPEGTIGEITLSGPSVMQGYYGDLDLTADTIRDGWLHTGDLGYLADGELFVCGRTKDTVVVNGRKHHPQDLEWAIDDLAGVRRGRVVAFGASRVTGGDRLFMLVEPSGAVAANELSQQIRHRVSDVSGLYVDDVVLVPRGTIARTTSGKVQRVAMKARYEAGEWIHTRSD